MRFAFLLLFAAMPVFAQDGAQKHEHLSPVGLPGSLLIAPKNEPTEAMTKRFVELAGGDSAKIVVLFQKDADAKPLLKLLEATKASVTSIVDPKDSDADKVAAATGVWLVEKDKQHFAHGLWKPILSVRQRGKIVAGTHLALVMAGQLPTGTFDAFTSTGAPDDSDDPSIQQKGSSPPPTETKKDPPAKPLRFFYPELTLTNGTALLVQGRQMSTVGDGKASIKLIEGNGLPARTIELEGKRTFDLNELVRASRDRMGQQPYPPKDPGVPEVKSGSLVIVGGGGMPADIAKRFIELGGGEEGHFVCLPTSMPDPVNMQAEGNFLKRMGAKNLVVLPGRELKDVEDPKNLEILKKATGLWFGGGRQWRFVDAYEGTKAYDLFHDVLKRGGVIGGSSAGATIQGDYLVRGAPAGPNIVMCEGYERAFRFLPGVAIDQHFSARRRFKDMSDLMDKYPQFLGIGIDEATALVVKGTTAEIMGPGKVHFYDRRVPLEKDKPEYKAYGAGTKYDLKERKVIARPQEKKIEKEPAKPDPAEIAKEIRKLQLERYEALGKQIELTMKRVDRMFFLIQVVEPLREKALLGGELLAPGSVEFKQNWESYLKHAEEAYAIVKKDGNRSDAELEQLKAAILDAKVLRLKSLSRPAEIKIPANENKPNDPAAKRIEPKKADDSVRSIQMERHATLSKQIGILKEHVVIGRWDSWFILDAIKKRALLGCDLYQPGSG